ncbi:signal recognition particle-docking protein FtsY [Victivallis sp. Marseille-Q1083]|uniref:signal recognition particle-docking protein FtsY n=1 Tax=Victivallis sp. Marseille-Q1083 TaxID=2717288 RepID=UPI00158B4362|nr:signal recognition particle-docking protein FtsY [Victivallis sp. Marseille-Q1083]
MKSIFSVFKRGLQKTTTTVKRSLAAMFSDVKQWDASTFEDLEAALIGADFGVPASLRIVAEIRDRYEHGEIETTADIFRVAETFVRDILAQNQREIRVAEAGKPTVVLFVGVNGSGKTTTIGKLAARLTQEGKKVMLAAGDTFRAAAVEQLQLWGKRTNSVVIAASHGADPASVAFDATSAALARQVDFLLIDTAGRQHTKKGLMDELSKICRSIDKIYPGAPHEVWLTVDSSMGSNALNQAREFSKAANVSGLVLTKLDGSGKGGMAVALHQEFKLPTFFVGMGEQPEDLQPFSPAYYAAAVFGSESLQPQE